MAVEIIKRGQLPAERKFAGTCVNCGTQIRCVAADGRFSSDQRDGDALVVMCPLCSRDIWARPHGNFGTLQPMES